MNKTANLQLPLLQAAQAQKHVTMNSSLAMLDTLVQLNVKSASERAVPVAPREGDSYIVPAGSVGEWIGRDSEIAVWTNGGWLFHQPRSGWTVWDQTEASTQTFDGVGWIGSASAVSHGGAATINRVVEFDHIVEPGALHFSDAVIPANSLVHGVSGRVMVDLLGDNLTSWRLGVNGSDNRYGSNLGTAKNSTALGLSGAPVAYYNDTALLLSAEGGAFTEGEIRLAVHYSTLVPPRAI